MKFLVTGSREFTDRYLIRDRLDHTLNHSTVILIHGAARGADALAHTWCLDNPKVYEIAIPAKWDLLGNPAGMARNRVMAELKPDVVLAFYREGAKNIGTRGMVRLARDAGVALIEEFWQT